MMKNTFRKLTALCLALLLAVPVLAPALTQNPEKGQDDIKEGIFCIHKENKRTQ